MDLSAYLKKSKVSSTRMTEKPRNCLNCSRELTKDMGHLFFQGFCSDHCKEEYVESVRATRG
jgi:hypothetical protein